MRAILDFEKYKSGDLFAGLEEIKKDVHALYYKLVGEGRAEGAEGLLDIADNIENANKVAFVVESENQILQQKLAHAVQQNEMLTEFLEKERDTHDDTVKQYRQKMLQQQDLHSPSPCDDCTDSTKGWTGGPVRGQFCRTCARTYEYCRCDTWHPVEWR